jgi:hypothetical protein
VTSITALSVRKYDSFYTLSRPQDSTRGPTVARRQIVRTNSLWYGSRALAAGIGAALSLGAPAVAQARTEVLRWTHPDAASVARFEIYFGTASRAYGDPVDAGKPTPESGVFSAILAVPADVEDEPLYIALRAVGKGGETSAFSNEKIRTPEGYEPPPEDSEPPPEDSEPPPPPQNAASSAVTGFVLWDANSQTILDADFQSGEQISLDAQGSCLAIEVVGNAYLQRSSSPGSVKFAFDGQSPTACSNAPISHESEPPYAWEAENGQGQYDCAATLTELGQHTLTVTPYDGDGCTGTVGTPVTLTFEVLGSTSSTDEPLGQPGVPVLVQ